MLIDGALDLVFGNLEHTFLQHALPFVPFIGEARNGLIVCISLDRF